MQGFGNLDDIPHYINFLQSKMQAGGSLLTFDAGRRWLVCFQLKDVFVGFVVGFELKFSAV